MVKLSHGEPSNPKPRFRRAVFGVGYEVCTAYEIGKRRGPFPDQLLAESIVALESQQTLKIVRPTLSAPVILPDGSLVQMSWGFRRSFASKTKGRKAIARTIVNSREDKLNGRMWKAAFRERRCLIPAGSFYEWTEVGKTKVPLRFEATTGAWLFIAGIWEDSEENGRCFSMITTEPNRTVAPVHDRMPAVLDQQSVAPFLDGTLHAFGPSSVALEYAKAENFLKPARPKDELF